MKTVCGLDHSLLQLDDGSVWSCGWGADGQTGGWGTEWTEWWMLNVVQHGIVLLHVL